MAIEPDVNPSGFPTELPPRNQNQSFKVRNCPNMRTLWHFNLSSYDPRNVDTQTRYRRIAMIVVLVLRVAMSALSIWTAIRNDSIAGIVIYSILAVLGTWFIAWCLVQIGDAVGERRVLGKLIVRINITL